MRNNIELQSIGLDPAVTLAYTAVRAPERECPNMVTPEPATFLLVGMAMACVLVRKNLVGTQPPVTPKLKTFATVAPEDSNAITSHI